MTPPAMQPPAAGNGGSQWGGGDAGGAAWSSGNGGGSSGSGGGSWGGGSNGSSGGGGGGSGSGAKTGTVKSWNNEKGFGFIGPDEDGEEDLFCHKSQLQGGAKSLGKGEKVRYDAERDEMKGKM